MTTDSFGSGQHPRVRFAVPVAPRHRHRRAAVVHLVWRRKTLTNEQKNLAAESFGAEGNFLVGPQEAVATQARAFKDVTAARGKVAAYWKSLTLPYPEPGIRLLRQHQMEEFSHQMIKHRGELDDAVVRLDDHYAEMKKRGAPASGRPVQSERLPALLQGLFFVEWDWVVGRAARLFASAQPRNLRTGKGSRGGAF